MIDKIDFVITWVDGNDIEWQKEKANFKQSGTIDMSPERYRSWDTLHYWFRGVEKFAPWVNRIHFVTWGHYPSWLNTKNPKLNIVRHEDFIPKQYLPTFSSHPIELNLHRIKGLEEQFIYFNDDTFLVKPVKITDFVKDGKPVERLVFNSIMPNGDMISDIQFNNIKLINRHFSKKTLIKKHFLKLFQLKYGLCFLRNLCLWPWADFTGFQDDHLPLFFNKRTFIEVWKKEYDVLNNTCIRKFRSADDVNPWVFRYWNMAQGNIVPGSNKRGKHLRNLKSDNGEINEFNVIKNQKYKMIACADTGTYEEFLVQKAELQRAFECILPQKSTFEL